MNPLFECRYKFSEEDNVKGSAVTYKHMQYSGGMLAVNIIIWIAIAISLISFTVSLVIFATVFKLLDYDSLLGLIFMLIFGVIYACMPLIQKNVARSVYRRNLLDKDEMVLLFDESRCSASFYKAGEETNKQILELKNISHIAEHNGEMVIIFEKRYFVVVKKQFFHGDWELFRKLVYSFPKD